MHGADGSFTAQNADGTYKTGKEQMPDELQQRVAFNGPRFTLRLEQPYAEEPMGSPVTAVGARGRPWITMQELGQAWCKLWSRAGREEWLGNHVYFEGVDKHGRSCFGS